MEDTDSNQTEEFYQTNFYEDLGKIPIEIVTGFLDPEHEYLVSKTHGSIIDVGCGNGRVLKYLKNGFRILAGIDYSQRQCESANISLPNAAIIKADAVQIPFQESNFDYVLCTFNTLGNMGPKKKSALEEMLRICKVQGKVILTVYSKRALEYQLKMYENFGFHIRQIDDRLVEVEEGLVSERFSREELSDLCSQFGHPFEIKELSDIAYLIEVTKQ